MNQHLQWKTYKVSK